MGRQPINVHVYLFRKNNSEFEYAIFHRADDEKCWQGVSGGVEDGETPEQAALRETHEEAGTPLSMPLYRLDTMCFIPSVLFWEHVNWGNDVVVCPMYFFAVNFDGEIILSREHTEVKWLPYEEAEKLVYWQDQKNALWELNQRLLRGNIERVV